MSQQRNDPFNIDGIQKISQELGKLFEGEWINPSSRYSENSDWTPATDKIETDSQWQFVIDIPGVSLKDIDLSVLRGEIHIKGSKRTDYSGNVLSSERRAGLFERVLVLPEDADEKTLEASMKNGVLTLTVDKSQVSSARVIPINDIS